MITLQTIPKLFLVPLLAQRRGEYILRSLEIRNIEVLDREIKVLRASFSVNRQAAIAGLTHFFQGIIATQVHDVNWRTRHLRQRYSPAGRFRFRRARPSQCVALGCFFPFRESSLSDDVNRASILGVHATQPAILFLGPKPLEDAAVV